MSKCLGVSLLEFCKQKGTHLKTCQAPGANSFRHAPFQFTLRAFGKGVSSRSSLGYSFSVSNAERNIPGNTRPVPPKTPFLKLLFRTPELSPRLDFPEPRCLSGFDPEMVWWDSSLLPESLGQKTGWPLFGSVQLQCGPGTEFRQFL